MSGKAWSEVIYKQGGLIYCASEVGSSVDKSRFWEWKMSKAWKEKESRSEGVGVVKSSQDKRQVRRILSAGQARGTACSSL